MLRRLWALFRRELSVSRPILVLVAGLIVLWDLFLWTRVGKWPENLPESLSVVPAFIILPWVVLASVQAWSREWQQGSIHYTMALPLPGWALPAVKGLAAVAEAAILGLTVTLAGLPLYSRLFRFGPEGYRLALPVYLLNGLKVGLVLAAILFALSLILQLGYIVGRASRFPALITPVTIACGIWFVFRVGGVLNRFLAWVPPIVLWGLSAIGRVHQFQASLLGTSPALSVAILGPGFLALAGWLIARQTDV